MLDESKKSKALELCTKKGFIAAKGLEECVYDVAATGDESLADIQPSIKQRSLKSISLDSVITNHRIVQSLDLMEAESGTLKVSGKMSKHEALIVEYKFSPVSAKSLLFELQNPCDYQLPINIVFKDESGVMTEQNIECGVQLEIKDSDKIVLSTPFGGVESLKFELLEIVPNILSGAVNLKNWQVVNYKLRSGSQVYAKWDISNDGESAIQINNADPSILVSDNILYEGVIEGDWQVNSASDDDYIGFVFAYQDPGHYYLFDWKGRSQDTAKMG